MELKVWCDGIQRVVCGATTTTTCQDIVFALAHATGQTGRFILIEKWRNSERILAPGDRPLASLAKWGEYSNDVTFLMKRSGDVSGQGRVHHKTSLTLNKKSDSELIHQRKELINSFINSSQDKKNNENSNISSSMVKSLSTIDHSMQHSSTLPSKNNAEPFVRSISFQVNSRDQFVEASSRFPENEGVKYRMDRNVVENDNYARLPLKNPNSTNPTNKIPFQNLNEPFYSTLSKSKKHRPRQPPPYQEAIAKSTLVNIINTNTEQPNSIYGTTTSLQKNVPSSQYGHNGAHNQMYTNSSLQERKYKKNSDSSLQPTFNSAIVSHSQNNPKSLSSIHNETISLIDMQQKTMKNQERDVVNIEKEINMVESKLSDNEFIVKRYKDEMELLKQLWVEQEMLIEKFESENIQDDLDRLISDEKKYENDLIEIKQKLSNCENEVVNCREEICKLMNKIDESCNARSNQKENNFDDQCSIEKLRASIQEKNQEIESQKNEINSLTMSIEHLDKSIQEKNELMNTLVIEIKDANVEGLSLQSAALIIEERESVNSDQSTPRSGSSRKIPVSPHELGKTVPTKKNPDGIWV